MLKCWNESVEQETQFSDLIWYNNNKKRKINNVSLSNYFESIIAAIHRTSVFDNFNCCKNKGANILPVCVCSEYEPLEWLEYYFFFLLSFNFEYIFTFCVWFFIILRAINSWKKYVYMHLFKWLNGTNIGNVQVTTTILIYIIDFECQLKKNSMVCWWNEYSFQFFLFFNYKKQNSQTRTKISYQFYYRCCCSVLFRDSRFFFLLHVYPVYTFRHFCPYYKCFTM